MACFVLHNIAKAWNQPDFEDDIVLDGDMFEIEMPTDEDNGSTPTAREESRVRRLGFETRNRIANLHFGCR